MFNNVNERKIWNRAARTSAVESVKTSAVLGFPALALVSLYAFTGYHVPRGLILLTGYGAVLGLGFALVALGCLAIVASTEG